MLLKLGGHISKCLERAASAKDRALQSQDSAPAATMNCWHRAGVILPSAISSSKALNPSCPIRTVTRQSPRKYLAMWWNSWRRRKTSRSSGARGSIMKLRSRIVF